MKLYHGSDWVKILCTKVEVQHWGDKRAKSDLDKQTSPSSGPPCLASGCVCSCAWPLGGSTGLRTEGQGSKSTRPEAGVAVGQRRRARGSPARRTRTVSVPRSRTTQPRDTRSSDLSHLGTKSWVTHWRAKLNWRRNFLCPPVSSYLVMRSLLLPIRRGCCCSPCVGWTDCSGAQGSGMSVETPGTLFVTDLMSAHLHVKKKESLNQMVTHSNKAYSVPLLIKPIRKKITLKCTCEWCQWNFEPHRVDMIATSWILGMSPGWRGRCRWRSLRKKGRDSEINHTHQQRITKHPTYTCVCLKCFEVSPLVS